MDVNQLATIRQQLQKVSDELKYIEDRRPDFISWQNDKREYFDLEQKKKDERKLIRQKIDELQDKFQKRFLVNSYQPIPAMLNGESMVILPPDGSFVFISDYQSFSVPEDIIIVGVENAENFRYVKRQQSFFELNFPQDSRLLFVSRYPQQQHGDLVDWLESISNRYVHFGDLDLAGIAIYQNEYYRYLGERSSFLIPDDYEERIAKGKRERYDDQLQQYSKMKIEDSRVEQLVSCIHRYHRGYDQEGYIGIKSQNSIAKESISE